MSLTDKAVTIKMQTNNSNYRLLKPASRVEAGFRSLVASLYREFEPLGLFVYILIITVLPACEKYERYERLLLD